MVRRSPASYDFPVNYLYRLTANKLHLITINNYGAVVRDAVNRESNIAASVLQHFGIIVWKCSGVKMRQESKVYQLKIFNYCSLISRAAVYCLISLSGQSFS